MTMRRRYTREDRKEGVCGGAATVTPSLPLQTTENTDWTGCDVAGTSHMTIRVPCWDYLRDWFRYSKDY